MEEEQETERPLILSIDPGLSGGICLYSLDKLAPVDILDMPTLRNNKGKKEIDAVTFAFYVQTHCNDISLAVIEKVHAMPKQGVTSMFTFGKVLGLTAGILSASFIPITWIYPQVWKASLNLSRNKDDSRSLAGKLYPEHKFYFARKRDDGRAEALLMAHFVCHTLVKEEEKRSEALLLSKKRNILSS